MKKDFFQEGHVSEQRDNERELLEMVLGELHTSLQALADMNQMAIHAMDTKDYKRIGYFLNCVDRVSLQTVRYVADVRTLLSIRDKGITIEEGVFDARELVRACEDYFHILNQENHLSFLWTGDLNGIYLGDEQKNPIQISRP